jgi:uncharacterized lipoprotein YddW (UPF0748 family)
MRKTLIWLVLMGWGILGCQSGSDRSIAAPPPAPREFRGVWVATVMNIDWPTQPGLSTADQKKEALAILDKCQQLKLNAVVLQVRTACDALYDSKIEPWSYFLTGEQGKAPNPFYDPLKFWIDEAHARGIELHAWFNPYRARPKPSKYQLASNHIRNTHPEAVKDYDGMYWLDPGEEAASDQSYRVFMDVVKRYNVDGIHIDDYFYPYPNAKKDPFPDTPAYDRYVQSGGKLAVDDWRRENVNALVQRIYEGAKKSKRWVKFGISPFGLYRPGFPEGTKGFDQYASLYADAQHWLNEGWCDYWTPQIYWRIDHPTVPFEPILRYWTLHNPKNRNLWPGLFTSRLVEQREAATAPSTQPSTRPGNQFTTQEILDQLYILRHTEGASGEVHFSMKALMRNSDGVSDALAGGPYREAALVPASGWLDAKAPAAPNVSVRKRGDGAHVSLSKPWFTESVWVYGLHVRYGETWKFRVIPGSQGAIDIPADATLGPVTAIAATSVDRCGNESKQVIKAVR